MLKKIEKYSPITSINNYKYHIKMEHLTVSECCECCGKYTGYHKDNYYFPSNNYHFDFVCKICFDLIDSKLVIQVDTSKLVFIKRKAAMLYSKRMTAS